MSIARYRRVKHPPPKKKKKKKIEIGQEVTLDLRLGTQWQKAWNDPTLFLLPKRDFFR